MSESNKREQLREQLMTAVVESGLSYQAAMSELAYVRVVLQDKGNNLLNAANIQEVAGMPRFISVRAHGNSDILHEDHQ